MYKIEFLPIAKKDIDDITYYISHSLKNIKAAKKLRNLFMSGIEDILEFPYGSPIYQQKIAQGKDYRCYKVKNFLIFYNINEEKRIITILRILYQKMDISKILN